MRTKLEAQNESLIEAKEAATNTVRGECYQQNQKWLMLHIKVRNNISTGSIGCQKPSSSLNIIFDAAQLATHRINFFRVMSLVKLDVFN